MCSFNPLYGLVPFFLGISTLVAACGSPQTTDPMPSVSVPENHFYNNYRTSVASSGQDAYIPYWLGQEFNAGGLSFRGPFADDFGSTVPGGGVRFHYKATLPPGTGAVDLAITLFSERAWDLAKSRYDVPGEEHVLIAGHSASLSSSSAGDRPVNVLGVTLHVDGTTVVAEAHSGGAATPGGPDVNPLVDEQTFLSVLQNLRPYPQ